MSDPCRKAGSPMIDNLVRNGRWPWAAPGFAEREVTFTGRPGATGVNGALSGCRECPLTCDPLPE
jgi:hypothetical protein